MSYGSRKGNVELREVVVEFDGRTGTVRAVEQLNLSVPSGQFVAVLGPSGCGKSTLLNVVAGFIAPTFGEALLDAQRIVKPGAERGVVFQQPTLFPWKSVRENIALGPRMAGLRAAEVERVTRHFMELVGLTLFADQYPDALSGGMQQRVGIARTLANNPSVLLMDEPFGALDAQTRELMQEELTRIWERTGKTVVFVTHDIEEAVYLGGRVLVLSARPARLCEEIPIDLPRPRNIAVRKSVACLEYRNAIGDMIRREASRPRSAGGVK